MPVSVLLYQDTEESFTHRTQNITYYEDECITLYSLQ